MIDHSVDSTFHRCCHAIGQHSRTCPDGPAAIFATTPEPADQATAGGHYAAAVRLLGDLPDCRGRRPADGGAADHRRGRGVGPVTAAAAGPAADHNVRVQGGPVSAAWYAYCSCGWRSPVAVSEHASRELAALHYLGDGGAADDNSAELAAAMRRHPAGSQR